MIQLDCWLPEKEMFGVFSVDSILFDKGALCAVVSNEVFQFTIRFASGVKAYAIKKAALCRHRFDDLQDTYKILMRNNTFFKLQGDPTFAGLKGEKDTHFLIASPNYMVDILADQNPAVELDMAPGRRPGGGL